ncbi:MAG: glycosyltransferase family 2 protein [Sphingobacterium sp.]
MMESKTTLIISTYNWPEALHLCLLSVKAQTRLPDEIIIAEDGSQQETKSLVEALIPDFQIPIKHIWQDDLGFRKSKILNKAFAIAQYDYIIQVDGDVFLHRDFVKDHISASKPNYLLQGSRVMLGERYSEEILQKGTPQFSLLSPGNKRVENALRIPLLSQYLLERYRNRYPIYFARGANMSFWKEDLYAINGYNESYEGWGHEDSDLTLRLMNYGVKKAVVKFAAVVYHLHHKENKKPELERKNKAIMENTLAKKMYWVEDGLNKYR